MALFDKMKGVVSKPDLQSTIEQYAPEIGQKIVSALGPQLEKSGEALRDDAKYRDLIATPLFFTLPPPVQLLGRERIKWDPIMLDVRDQVIVAEGGRLSVRANAPEIVVAIVRKHFAA